MATMNGAGLGASLFMICAQAFIFIGLFGLAAWLEKANRGTVDEIIGLAKDNKYAAMAASLLMLSVVGLPFTTGFVGRSLIILSAVNAGLSWLAVLGIANCAIAAFYYAKAITAMYTERSVAGRHLGMGICTAAVVLACIILTLAMGLYPSPFIGAINNAAAYLLH